MTDEAHTPPRAAGSPSGAGRGERTDITSAAPERAAAGSAPGPWYGRAVAAAGGGLRRFRRWLAAWCRRLAPSPFLWAGLVLGFGTSLLVWESVLLLGVAVWAVGAWLWSTRGTPALVALGVGVVIGWLPLLFFFVTSLPHTMIGPPGVEYDL